MLAEEAEIGAMYVNSCEAVPQIIALLEMGHPQPRTQMKTDNSAAYSIVTNNIYSRRTNAMDVSLHWLKCRDSQGHLRYHWRPGKQNLLYYCTKHHPSSHYIAKIYKVFTPTCQLELLQSAKVRI